MIVKPLPPINEADKRTRPQNDKAGNGGYSYSALERLLLDCEDQPEWRTMSDLCCAYYDGKQLTPQQIWEAKQNGLEPRSTNLIGRVINGVLGMEEKARRDPTNEPDDDEFADVADVLNVKLKEAQREAYADMAIGNGYGSQVKAGIGWVEVSRSDDPMQYHITVSDVHRSEMWFDWRARKVDLSDARWMLRRQWKDLDEVIATFPEHAEALKHVGDGWATWLPNDDIDEIASRGGPGGFDDGGSMTMAYNADRAFKVNRSAWLDGGRRRIRMYEVWYKVPAEIVVMRLGHRWVPLDPENMLHVQAISRGLGKLKKTMTMQIRKAMFAGPLRLTDEATTKKRYPYVPFIAFRSDSDMTPYGLIHGMLSPQDEFNERRMRIQWMLKAQQLMIDNDALDPDYNNIADITKTMGRPDMVAVLNASRQNKDGIHFRNDIVLQKEQFESMQDSKQLIQDVPGVYSTQLGNNPTGVTSGVAINSLVEAGITAMGELNGNYVHSRRLVHESLVDLIAEDHLERDMQVQIGTGQTRRTVVLNTVDPQTGKAVNVVKDAPVKVGLGEVPASAAYQMQMSQMMGDMLRSLAGTPQAALLIPSWVETTQAFGSGRKQLADDMRRMTGLPTTGDRQGAQAWQEQQQQAAAAKGELERKAAASEVANKDATAELSKARAALAQAQAALAMFQADAIANDPNEQALIDATIAEAMGGQPTGPQGDGQAPQGMPPPRQPPMQQGLMTA